MKRLRANKILIVILMLTIILFVPFLVGKKTVHAEESAPPIEYWLERESVAKRYSNEGPEFAIPRFKKDKKIKLGKFVPKTIFANMAFFMKYNSPEYLVDSISPPKKQNKLSVFKFSNFQEFRNVVFYTHIYGSELWWLGYDVEMDLYLYKNASFVCKKDVSYSATPKRPHGMVEVKEVRFKDQMPILAEGGLFIFHIKKATALTEYYSQQESFVFIEDKIVAVQIGNDDFCDNFKG